MTQQQRQLRASDWAMLVPRRRQVHTRSKARLSHTSIEFRFWLQLTTFWRNLLSCGSRRAQSQQSTCCTSEL